MKFKSSILFIFTICTLYNCNSQQSDNIKFPLIYTGHYRELMEACEKEDTFLIGKIMYKHKLNPNYVESKSCISLLNWCIINHKINSTEALLKMGADPNWADSNCTYPPPITIATEMEQPLIFLKLMVKYKGDVNVKSSNFIDPNPGLKGKSPLYAAIYSGEMDKIKLLVDNGADINLRIDSTPSPLALALLHRKLVTVKYLLDEGADFKELNFVTLDGEKLTIYDFLDKIKPMKDTNQMELKKKIIEYLELKNYKRKQ